MSYVEDRIEAIKTNRARAPGYKNVERQVNRHGTPVYYYRVGKGKRIRLPDRTRVGEDAFRQAYQAAAEGETLPRRRETRPIVPAAKSPIGVPGYVYFARSGDEVKIGFSKDFHARAKTIQTSSAKPIEIVAVIPGSVGTETFFHERFADYRVGGEWFRLVGILADFLGVKPNPPLRQAKETQHAND